MFIRTLRIKKMNLIFKTNQYLVHMMVITMMNLILKMNHHMIQKDMILMVFINELMYVVMCVCIACKYADVHRILYIISNRTQRICFMIWWWIYYLLLGAKGCGLDGNVFVYYIYIYIYQDLEHLFMLFILNYQDQLVVVQVLKHLFSLFIWNCWTFTTY